ncbi:MAG: hypothetical protein RLZZ612_1062 [Pseudomonadota bacterium]
MSVIKYFFILTLCSLSACATTGTTTPNNSGQEIITESDEPELRRRARIRLELASGYFEQEKYNIALDEIKQSLAADPSYGPAYNLRGLIYAQLNEVRLAEESFRKSLSINAKDTDALHNLGWLICQQQRYTEAQKMFDEIVNTTANSLANANTWLTKGLCYARGNDFANSSQSLMRAYELDSLNPITAYNLSLVLYFQRLFEKSRFYINRLNESQYSNPESIWLQIRVEYKLNQDGEVKRLGKRLTEKFPNSKESSLYLRGKFDD